MFDKIRAASALDIRNDTNSEQPARAQSSIGYNDFIKNLRREKKLNKVKYESDRYDIRNCSTPPLFKQQNILDFFTPDGKPHITKNLQLDEKKSLEKNYQYVSPALKEHMERMESRLEASRKLQALNSRLELILQRLDDSTQEIIFNTAEDINLAPSEIMTSTGALDFRKLVMKNKSVVNSILDNYDDICHTRSLILGNLQSWFDVSYERDEHYNYLFKETNKDNKAFLEQSKKSIEQLLETLNNASKKLISFDQELKKAVELVTCSAKGEPSSVLREKMNLLQEKLQNLTEALEKATTQAKETEKRSNILETMLSNEKKEKERLRKNSEREIAKLRKNIQNMLTSKNTMEKKFQETIQKLQRDVEAAKKAARTKQGESSDVIAQMNVKLAETKELLEHKDKTIAKLNEIIEQKDFQLRELDQTNKTLQQQVEEQIKYATQAKELLENEKKASAENMKLIERLQQRVYSLTSRDVIDHEVQTNEGAYSRKVLKKQKVEKYLGDFASEHYVLSLKFKHNYDEQIKNIFLTMDDIKDKIENIVHNLAIEGDVAPDVLEKYMKEFTTLYENQLKELQLMSDGVSAKEIHDLFQSELINKVKTNVIESVVEVLFDADDGDPESEKKSNMHNYVLSMKEKDELRERIADLMETIERLEQRGSPKKGGSKVYLNLQQRQSKKLEVAEKKIQKLQKKIEDQQADVEQLKQSKAKCKEIIEDLKRENKKLQALIKDKEKELMEKSQQTTIVTVIEQPSEKTDISSESIEETKTEKSTQNNINEPATPKVQVLQLQSIGVQQDMPETNAQLTQTPIVHTESKETQTEHQEAQKEHQEAQNIVLTETKSIRSVAIQSAFTKTQESKTISTQTAAPTGTDAETQTEAQYVRSPVEYKDHSDLSKPEYDHHQQTDSTRFKTFQNSQAILTQDQAVQTTEIDKDISEINEMDLFKNEDDPSKKESLESVNEKLQYQLNRHIRINDDYKTEIANLKVELTEALEELKKKGQAGASREIMSLIKKYTNQANKMEADFTRIKKRAQAYVNRMKQQHMDQIEEVKKQQEMQTKKTVDKYKEEYKKLFEQLSSIKIAHAHLHNKMETYIKEIQREYPVTVVDEIKDIKLDDDEKFNIDAQLIQLSAKRLSTLFQSMKKFIDTIFDKSSNSINEREIKRKFEEMNIQAEQKSLSKTIKEADEAIKQEAQKRNTQLELEMKKIEQYAQKHINPDQRRQWLENMKSILQDKVDVQNAAREVLKKDKQLREQKVAATLHKMAAHKQLLNLQAEIYYLRVLGVNKKVLAVLQRMEALHKERVLAWQRKRDHIQAQIEQNTANALYALGKLLYHTESEGDNEQNPFWRSISYGPVKTILKKKLESIANINRLSNKGTKSYADAMRPGPTSQIATNLPKLNIDRGEPTIVHTTYVNAKSKKLPVIKM